MTIDVGCSVGRTTFELAQHSNDLVLGVDLNFAMLRLASQILQTGQVSYSRRRIGIVYDRQEFPYSPSRADHVDFWACDALAFPFKPQTFSFGIALNLLDCVSSPVDLLKSIGCVLSPHGKLVLTTPFDWSAVATSVEAWIGGHSQRTPAKGAPEMSLRTLIVGGPAVGLPEMTIVAEQDSITWDVRLHDRAIVSYRMHLIIAEKAGPGLAISSESKLDH
jgi:SAM-dependent methyltransferase